MREFAGRVASRLMPRTFDNLKKLSDVSLDDDAMVIRLLKYEEELRELKAELNEVRRDNRRVVELYELVFNRLQDDMPLRSAPVPSGRD